MPEVEAPVDQEQDHEDQQYQHRQGSRSAASPALDHLAAGCRSRPAAVVAPVVSPAAAERDHEQEDYQDHEQ